MTLQHNSADQAPGAGATEELSGVDLAKLALQAARQMAKKRGNESAAVRKHSKRTSMVRVDRREPAGFGAVLQTLVAERAWNVAVAGGGVLDRWDQIAPDLAQNIQAVAFDPDRGQLDLRPASNAHATHLRLTARQLMRSIAEHTGPGVVRTIRVLPPGTAAAANDTGVPGPLTAAASSPVAPRGPSPGYHRTLEALWRSKPAPLTPPQIHAARDRQTEQLLAHREPPDQFTAAADFHGELAQLREQEERRRSDEVQQQALRRARQERAAAKLPSIVTAPPTATGLGQTT